MSSPIKEPTSRSFKGLFRIGRNNSREDMDNKKLANQIDPFPYVPAPNPQLQNGHPRPILLDVKASFQTSPHQSPVSPKGPSPANSDDSNSGPSQERQDTIRPEIRNTTHPSVRIILTAHAPNRHSFNFDPVTFELVDHGPHVTLCRAERSSRTSTIVTVNKVSFSTRVVTRGCHAHIWLENERIWIQDMGSSAGTWVNHVRLESAPNTLSRKRELENGDMIVLGQDYMDPNHQDFSFKSVMARISIEYISTEITFHCRSNCHCPWRVLFERQHIYSLSKAVDGPRRIYEAINIWIRSPETSDRLEALGSEEGELLMAVIERIIETMSWPSISPYAYTPEELTPNEISSCQSWIRKIARKSGVFPRSFVVCGVKKIEDDPVACGGYSDIYRGMFEDYTVALKVIRNFGATGTSRQMQKDVSHEALLWKHLRHPHIQPFMGICRDHFIPRLVLVSPWMQNGDILRYLEDNPQEDRVSLLSQCAHGLKYLHGLDPALVHGDIKGGNILIDDEGNARLSDFGLVSISGTQDFNTTIQGGEHKGTMRWMAPELFLLGEKKSRGSDIYAFGMTIIEVYTGKPPFFEKGYSDLQVMMAVSEGVRHPRPDASTLLCELPDELWELVESCLKDLKSRPNARQIVDELDSLYAKREDERMSIIIPLDERNLENVPPFPEPSLPYASTLALGQRTPTHYARSINDN